ncbi:MAG: Inner membrane protein YohC [Glaciecola sp. HTCC2999]|mgnify:FL=1|jgi:hypothetical protein|nr:MAG: Inner membrane protein YohC [Glaciecola sp. HTCC2999]
MILNHLWGLYLRPRSEWQQIDRNHENYWYAISHILIIALIPAVCSYYASAHIGWSIGAGDTIRLTHDSALFMSLGMYFGLVLGVTCLAMMIHELAEVFDSTPTITQALELAAYTATPLFMVGFACLYPELWFISAVGLAGLAYSIYLLYSGVPILMHIPEEKGFIYASTVVTCGLVILSVLMAMSVILLGSGSGITYM